MKLIVSAALVLAATVSPALAQDATTAATAGEAAAPAGTEAAARFTLDTPIEQIVADDAARAVLDADLPGVSTHESYEMFKGMSLKQLQPYSAGALTDEALAKVEADLAEVE